MQVSNGDVARILNELGDLLEIEGANAFRVRAYRNAARVIEALPRPVAAMAAAGEDLAELPGIGEALAKKIAEIAATGRLEALERETQTVPLTVLDLLKIPGLGPRRVKTLLDRLKIDTLARLEASARAGRLRELEGFGEKIESRIVAHFDLNRPLEQRFLWAEAEAMVAPLLEALRGAPGVRQVIPAGSFRRRMETVGDIDILAAGPDGAEALRLFSAWEGAGEVLACGGTRSSLRLRSGLQVDLRVVPEESYGAALNYFTGSKAHNIAIRTRGVQAGLKINEYGVFRGGERVSGAKEADVFAAVGLPTIEPELREDRGEIEAASEGRLPALVSLEDIRGDLQSHTLASDGQADIAAMARAAQARGYEYLAVTDHSRRLTVAHGLDAARLAQQIRDIDRLNGSLRGFRVLKSVEVEIIEDGSLDLDDGILRELDLVVGAVHFKLNLPRAAQTERLVRALDHPRLHILAHPTGRLIGERAACDLDLERLVRAARERGCALELNAQPRRLDADDRLCRMARGQGVKIALSSDAHDPAGLDAMRFGIGQARRGWLEPNDILNTRPWSAVRKLLRRA